MSIEESVRKGRPAAEVGLAVITGDLMQVFKALMKQLQQTQKKKPQPKKKPVEVNSSLSEQQRTELYDLRQITIRELEATGKVGKTDAYLQEYLQSIEQLLFKDRLASV